MAQVTRAGRALKKRDILRQVKPIVKDVCRFERWSVHHPKGRYIRFGIANHHNTEQPQLTFTGVCVSGGPDSMAMAYLLKALGVVDGVEVEPFGIIVDHRARSNSTEEARWVQNELTKIGIRSSIAPLRWESGEQPLAMSNFESVARTQRYRAIAQTALKHDIEHIFTGHHRGDQEETIMMRLQQQHLEGLSGLRGMASMSTLPCCDDIFGVHETRDLWPVCSKAHPKVDDKFIANNYNVSLPSASSRLFFGPHGLFLHRPLLDFPKADLIETCVHNQISFVTDPTNNDPKLTARNAVRALCRDHTLPIALRPKRLLELQTQAQASLRSIQQLGSQFLNMFLIRNLCLTSGLIEVQLPFLQGLSREEIQGLSNAISRLIELVTPAPRHTFSSQIPLSVLMSLFPEAVEHQLINEDPSSLNLDRSSFTFHKVFFIPHPTEENVWTIERQPMRSIEIAPNIWTFDDIEVRTDGYSATHWKLWDNRFWIRLYGNDAELLKKIQIAPFTPDLLEVLREKSIANKPKLKQHPMRDLIKLLSTAAPGKTRFALPVLLLDGEPICFPTIPALNTNANLSKKLTAVEMLASVRYKTVEAIQHLRIVRTRKSTKPDHKLHSTPLLRLFGLKDMLPMSPTTGQR